MRTTKKPVVFFVLLLLIFTFIIPFGFSGEQMKMFVGTTTTTTGEGFWKEHEVAGGTGGIVPPTWVHQLGAAWMVCLIIGGALIFFGPLIATRTPWYKWGKSLVVIGLGIAFISTFIIELLYLIPRIAQPVIGYQECKTLQGGWMEAAACIFTGYAPSSWDIYNVSTFIIFGFVAPIAILFILFYEFTGGLISHTGAHRVLALVIALMAYRGLLATLFIDLLTYGFAGIGVLLVDYLIFGIFYNIIAKTWKWRETTQSILEGIDILELAKYKDTLETYENELRRAISAPQKDMNYIQYLEQKIKETKDEIQKLSGKKPGEK